MRESPRRALRRGRNAILWENDVIGAADVRYFVQGLGRRRHDSGDFGRLPDAEQHFDRIENAGPRAA
jgi:hypothetical protein